MVHVRLIKGASYHGEVHASKKNPDVFCNEATAKRLVASGYFESVGQVPFTDDEPLEENALSASQEDDTEALKVKEVETPTEEEKPLKKADMNVSEDAEKKVTKTASKSGTGKAAAKTGSKKAAKSK